MSTAGARRIPRLLSRLVRHLLRRVCRVGWIDRHLLERLPLRLLLWIAPLNQQHRAQVRAHLFVADAVFGDDHAARAGWLARHVGYDPEPARQYRRHRKHTGDTDHDDTEYGDDGPGADITG